MEHIAIMKKSWGLTQKILAGEKKIESRWYMARCVPWNRIKAGETVYFKDSGEPVTVKAKVGKVLQFADLSPKKVQAILSKYGGADGLNIKQIPKLYQKFKNKKYCILVFLKNPQKIKPFKINKSGFGLMAAWLTVNSVNSIKMPYHKPKLSNKLSLLNFCVSCKSKCCKTGELIGTPIISIDEFEKIPKSQKKCLKKIISPTNEAYYIVKDRQTSNRCFFLNIKNKCRIEKNKPLDCLCYPVKAVYSKNIIKYLIDHNCPASPHLSDNFIRVAKKIAFKSLKRFDKETYCHWLDNYIGWTKNKRKIYEY